MFRQRSQLSPPKIESTAVLMAVVTFVMVFLSSKSKHQTRIARRLILNEACHARGSGGGGARVCHAHEACVGRQDALRISLWMRVYGIIGAGLPSRPRLPPAVNLLFEAINGGGVLHRDVAGLGWVFL